MFEKIISHDDNKKLFEKSIHGGNVSHAYLFFGKRGVGKCTFAKEFAKVMLNVPNLESSPDYKYISKLPEKKDIIIEQIRKELIDDIYEKPISGKYKIYIIDGAENLNISAQNALLKTLEEPPSYVIIILVSSNMATFLPTIISRVNIINFSGIDKELVSKYIEENYNVKLVDNILDFVDGSIGQAINIVQEKRIEKYELVDNLYKFIIKKDLVNIFKTKDDLNIDMDLLDYLEYILYKNLKYSCCKFVERAKIRLKNNGNYDIVIDSMLLKIVDNIL